MRFFADRARDEDPRTAAEGVVTALRGAAALPAGPVRHAAVAAALVRAGELAQGLGDAADAGACPGAAARAALDETARIARGLWRSFEAGGRVAPPAPRALALPRRSTPPSIRLRRPEGYALYAVYPEAFALAGRALRGARATFIGVRSIGTGLAAMAAAGAGARGPIFAVRPGGSPFARTLPPAVLAEALAGGGGTEPRAFAVVDEGPGLSGSTLAAVAEALLAAGVPEDRVHLVTSHAGPPGPEASPRVRELFARLPRHAAPPLGARGPFSPAALAGELLGLPGAVRAIAELGDGGWRAFAGLPGPSEDGWPPSTGWMERRKVLLVAADGRRWLARFAGLGEDGERKLARAAALHAAGLAPAPAGLRHGWLFLPWIERARPISEAAPVPRARLLDAFARLLSVSASRPAPPALPGATAAELAEAVRANAAEALGPEAAAAARRLEELVPRVAAEARPSEIDGRFARWKWLALDDDGSLVKCDGVDHHAGHELAGCQDLLWDVAGAEAELGLTPREAVRLAELARARAPGADPSLLPFYRAAYRAQELGRWSFAAVAVAPGLDEDERRRRLAERERHRRGLAEALSALVRGVRASAPGASHAAR